MKSSSALRIGQDAHLEHLFKMGVLANRATKKYPRAVRHEAEAELLRYRDQGRIVQAYGKELTVTKATRAHEEPATYSGQGIMYVVIDDREDMPDGNVTTIDVIADAIESALDNGFEDSESIARYLTTSAFQHVTDKRIRFNSVLKAGDVVGAHIMQKLHNAYNELAKLADDETDARKKAEIKAEATGFAEALNIVMSPFSCEDPSDSRLVNWDEVDRITAAFEKEQRFVIRERKDKIQ